MWTLFIWYRIVSQDRDSSVKSCEARVEGDGIIRSEPAEGGRDLAFDTWLLLISRYYSLGTLVLLYCTCTIIDYCTIRCILLYNVNLLVGPWILGYTHTHTPTQIHKIYSHSSHLSYSHTHTPTPTPTYPPSHPLDLC